jgi:dolichol-phosphate mannosyltransferase
VSGRYLPSKFLLFGAVGASGMVVHLVVLRVLLAAAGASFVGAQSTATAIAMVWNYFLNNTLTYREYRLVGWAALRGLASFMLICGLGAVVNVLVARDLYSRTLCDDADVAVRGGWRSCSRCAPQLFSYFGGRRLS